jgi:hypothetical protein
MSPPLSPNFAFLAHHDGLLPLSGCGAFVDMARKPNALVDELLRLRPDLERMLAKGAADGPEGVEDRLQKVMERGARSLPRLSGRGESVKPWVTFVPFTARKGETLPIPVVLKPLATTVDAPLEGLLRGTPRKSKKARATPWADQSTYDEPEPREPIVGGVIGEPKEPGLRGWIGGRADRGARCRDVEPCHRRGHRR